jgi:hypothetical protein
MPRRTYVDDNFGTWDIEDQEDIEFYHRVQKESRRKKCKGCGKMARLRPEYVICNECAEKMERGGS